MKKSEITVVIDSIEKQQRAIEILNKYKEHIWEEDFAMNFEPFRKQLVFTSGDWYICFDIDLNDEIEITLDQLDEVLKNQ